MIAPRDQIHALIQHYAEQQLSKGVDWIDHFRDIMARDPATWDDGEKRFIRTVSIYGVQAFIDRFVDDRIESLELLADDLD